MRSNEDVRDQSSTEKGTQTYIQQFEDLSDLDPSNESFKSSSIQDYKNHFTTLNVTGIDEQTQCDSDELNITLHSYKSTTSDIDIEINYLIFSKTEILEDKQIQCDSSELNKTPSSRKIFLAASKTGICSQNGLNSNKLNTTCYSCKYSTSDENISNKPLKGSTAIVDKQIQGSLNDFNKTLTSLKSSKIDEEFKKSSLLLSNNAIDDQKNCYSCKPLKEGERGVDKEVQCDLNKIFSSPKSYKKDEKFRQNSLVKANTGIDKQLQCDLNELLKTLSEPLKKYLRLYRSQNEPSENEISEQKCKLEYCKCLEIDVNKSIKFHDKAGKGNFEENFGVNSSESNVETKTNCNIHGECVRTVATMTSSNDFPKVLICSRRCLAFQKSSTEVASIRLDSKVSSKMTQTLESNLNLDNQRSFSPIGCFRTCFGPSLDETLFYTVDCLPLFKQFVRNLLPRTCGGNRRNNDHDHDSFDGNI